MTSEEAMNRMRSGQAVRRLAWDDDAIRQVLRGGPRHVVLRRLDGREYVHQCFGIGGMALWVPVKLSVEDENATDWVVYRPRIACRGCRCGLPCWFDKMCALLLL